MHTRAADLLRWPPEERPADVARGLDLLAAAVPLWPIDRTRWTALVDYGGGVRAALGPAGPRLRLVLAFPLWPPPARAGEQSCRHGRRMGAGECPSPRGRGRPGRDRDRDAHRRAAQVLPAPAQSRRRPRLVAVRATGVLATNDTNFVLADSAWKEMASGSIRAPGRRPR
jgi:hypothetical protein